MANKVYVGDIGTLVKVDCGQDISDSTVFKILVKKPDKTEHEWDGVLGGTDYIEYNSQAGDFDQAGTYQIQAYIDTPTWQGKGETAKFTVYKKFTG